MFDDLKGFAKAVAKHWLVVLGTSILGLIWTLVQQPSLSGFKEPQFWAPPLCGFAVACFLAWREEHKRARAFDSKFDIVFVVPGDEERRPFFQELTFMQPQGPGNTYRRMLDRRYRIGVINLSSAIVPKVQATLVACQPSGNFIHIGHRLLAMDSTPPAGERDLPLSPDGRPSLWFDVVNECGPAEIGKAPSHFMFCYANQDLCGPVDDGTFKIMIRVDGGGYTIERSFQVRKDFADLKDYPRGRLRMTAL